MPSGHLDSTPNRGERKGGNKNNVDGRIKGAGWDRQGSPFGGQDDVPSFTAKSVGVEPNDTIPKEGLGKRGVVGKVVE